MKKDFFKKLLSVMFCFMLVFSISNTKVHAESNNVQLYFAKIVPNYGNGGLIETYYATGSICVKNIGSNKTVKVHYTYDGYNWLDSDAYYEKTLNDGTELFKFETPAFPYVYDHQIEYNCKFAIKYEVDGETYWDNNDGNDYFVQYSTMDYNAPYVLSKSVVTLHDCINNGNCIWGNIILKNLAYEKEVFVRYTTDNWETYNEVPARHIIRLDNGLEEWVYSTTKSGTPFLHGSHGEFAICYKANGVTYWDNNFGENYTF